MVTRSSPGDLAVEAFVPEIVGQVGLGRIQPQAAEGKRPLEGFGLAGIEEPGHRPFAKGFPDLEREDGMAVGVEEVHRARCFAVGRQDLLQDLEPARIEVGQAVTGEQVSAGEGDE